MTAINFEKSIVDVDSAFDTLDFFKNISNKASKLKNKELEARCYAHMGFIHHRVFKDENKAMKHFTNALKLAEVLKSS